MQIICFLFNNYHNPMQLPFFAKWCGDQRESAKFLLTLPITANFSKTYDTNISFQTYFAMCLVYGFTPSDSIVNSKTKHSQYFFSTKSAAMKSLRKYICRLPLKISFDDAPTLQKTEGVLKMSYNRRW